VGEVAQTPFGNVGGGNDPLVALATAVVAEGTTLAVNLFKKKGRELEEARSSRGAKKSRYRKREQRKKRGAVGVLSIALQERSGGCGGGGGSASMRCRAPMQLVKREVITGFRAVYFCVCAWGMAEGSGLGCNGGVWYINIYQKRVIKNYRAGTRRVLLKFCFLQLNILRLYCNSVMHKYQQLESGRLSLNLNFN
jgi:hypothetical protein